LRRDLACAALGLALAGAYWAAADALPVSLLADEVGAGGVPKALAVLLALFSAGIAFRALARGAPAAAPGNHFKALGIAALGFAYVFVAPLIGYLIAVTLLAGGAALYYGARRPGGVALFALGSAALLWLVFGALLGIPLP
jgi:putative tricarboxylic transport membrane protein